ncbi:hypothetical protein [Demequina lutea]|uniref:Uncharacterized protein n=2 Tax=Demequina lutea TaxID=431489 RepID=A0A7Y9Z7A9_9MICO|nr:hypothetical protein [Demequina lutea]NYI40137.1 hypothetical protein [Demequina lutea]
MCAMFLAGSHGVRLPSFAAVALRETPFTVIAALLLSIALVGGLGGGDPRLEAIAVRRIAAFDTAMLVTVPAAFAVAGLASQIVTRVAVVVAVRALVGFIGLGLLACAQGGRLAGTVSQVAFFVLVTLLGPTTDGSVQVWAFPIAAPSSAVAAAVAGGLALSGATIWLLMGPERAVLAKT